MQVICNRKTRISTELRQIVEQEFLSNHSTQIHNCRFVGTSSSIQMKSMRMTTNYKSRSPVIFSSPMKDLDSETGVSDRLPSLHQSTLMEIDISAISENSTDPGRNPDWFHPESLNNPNINSGWSCIWSVPLFSHTGCSLRFFTVLRAESTKCLGSLSERSAHWLWISFKIIFGHESDPGWRASDDSRFERIDRHCRDSEE
jgi:hypothetical protein